MKGTCVLRAACASVANCSALVKPSTASGSFVPRASTGFMRACSSGADTGIVITSLGAASGAGVLTAARPDAARATRSTRLGLAGAAGAAGSATVWVVTAAGAETGASRFVVSSVPIHAPSTTPPTRPSTAAEVFPEVMALSPLLDSMVLFTPSFVPGFSQGNRAFHRLIPGFFTRSATKIPGKLLRC
jgi:hypothetical protein